VASLRSARYQNAVTEAPAKQSSFRRLWAAIKGLFTRKKGGRVVRGIVAAPLTLVARISAVDDKERQAIKLAEEALRRGYPDQAVVAYWKAGAFFMEREQYNKALSMLNAILRIKPDDLQAALERVRACEGLDRKRDAAFACAYAAQLHEAQGHWDEARVMRARSIELDPRLAPPDGAPPGPQLRLQSSVSTPAVMPSVQELPLPEPSELAMEQPLSAIDRLEDDAPLELELERSVVVSAPSREEDLMRHPETGMDDADALTVGMAAIAREDLAGGVTDEESAADPQVDEDAATIAIPSIDAVPPATTFGAGTKKPRIAAEVTIALPEAEPPQRQTPQRQVRFAIPQAATTADVGLPSSVVGTEHEADAREEVSSRIPGGDTKVVTPEELERLKQKLKLGS
jgi:tetratricopeptide (TPR) repeat protein